MSEEVEIPAVETYQEYQERLSTEQAGKSKDQVLAEQGGIDLDNLPKQSHNWVQRGIVLSCEGVHTNHRHFLR